MNKTHSRCSFFSNFRIGHDVTSFLALSPCQSPSKKFLYQRAVRHEVRFLSGSPSSSCSSNEPVYTYMYDIKGGSKPLGRKEPCCFLVGISLLFLMSNRKGVLLYLSIQADQKGKQSKSKRALSVPPLQRVQCPLRSSGQNAVGT